MTAATLVATPDPAAWRSLPLWASEYLDYLASCDWFYGQPWRSSLLSFARTGDELTIYAAFGPPFGINRDQADAMFARRLRNATPSETPGTTK